MKGDDSTFLFRYSVGGGLSLQRQVTNSTATKNLAGRLARRAKRALAAKTKKTKKAAKPYALKWLDGYTEGKYSVQVPGKERFVRFVGGRTIATYPGKDVAEARWHFECYMADDGAPKADKLVVSYGMGLDSTAVLVGLAQRGIRPDAILFADTGGERPATYLLLDTINAWLRGVGFPEVTVVKLRKTQAVSYSTLEEQCHYSVTFPGLAFGGKSCSQKWKGDVLDSHVSKHVASDFVAGSEVVRIIGYDAGTKDMKRGKSAPRTGEATRWWYPLREWGWDRDECQRQVLAAGLPDVRKSCCFFCPANKEHEVLELADNHPDLARRAVALEDRAQDWQEIARKEWQEAIDRGETKSNGKPPSEPIQGLWGHGRKGTRRGFTPKPGTWREFLETHRPGLLAPATGAAAVFQARRRLPVVNAVAAE